MYPDTRGRISTDSTGSSRPVNSSHSFTSFSTTVTTLTGKAGCCVTDAFLQPLPVKKTSKKAAHAKKNCFIQSDSHSFELIANCGFEISQGNSVQHWREQNKVLAADQRHFTFDAASQRFVLVHRRAESGKSASDDAGFFICRPRLPVTLPEPVAEFCFHFSAYC